MKNNLILATIIAVLPLIANAQKGRHFEFNYFVLELGVNNNFNFTPDSCMYRYLPCDDGNYHLYPVKGMRYTPGFNVGIQFHHDLQNDCVGLIFGLTVNSWGNTGVYETTDKKIKLTENNRVLSLGIPFYVKLGQEIYNKQLYFYAGAQLNYNLKLTTYQKVSTANKRLHNDSFNDALNKMSFPIVMGVNYSILNFRVGVIPKGLFKDNYEIPMGDDMITPFKGASKATIFLNFAFTIPLSQWTVRRSYLLSRIF